MSEQGRRFRATYAGAVQYWNIWLHRQVMSELERNGGLVPATMKA